MIETGRELPKGAVGEASAGRANNPIAESARTLLAVPAKAGLSPNAHAKGRSEEVLRNEDLLHTSCTP